MGALPAAIPSPPSNAIHIGPLQLRAYGVMIAVGVATAIVLAQRRWAARGGDPVDISRLAIWCVGAGLIGARVYHVITDHRRFEGRWLDALKLWDGGLGIPGGLLAGALVGVVLARRRSLPVAELLDVAAPAIPVAQAIGRLGNWFNQELFGRATELPWGLRIDPEHRPAGLEHVARPTPGSLTRLCGTWPWPRPSSPTSGAVPADARGGSSSSVWRARRSAGSGWRRCASIPPASFSASG